MESQSVSWRMWQCDQIRWNFKIWKKVKSSSIFSTIKSTHFLSNYWSSFNLLMFKWIVKQKVITSEIIQKNYFFFKKVSVHTDSLTNELVATAGSAIHLKRFCCLRLRLILNLSNLMSEMEGQCPNVWAICPNFWAICPNA